MKRYGNNLPSSCEEEQFNAHGGAVQVIRGGCGVRYDMLAYLQPKDMPKENKPFKLFSFFKPEKKTEENK